jgi:hypothetical protein
LNDDDVVFVEVLALVDKFHEAPPEGLFLQNQNDSMVDRRSLSALRRYYPAVRALRGNKKRRLPTPMKKKPPRFGENPGLSCRRVFIGGFV